MLKMSSHEGREHVTGEDEEEEEGEDEEDDEDVQPRRKRACEEGEGGAVEQREGNVCVNIYMYV